MDLPSTETIVSHLNKGIVAICNTCKSILDAQVDPTTRPNYEQMKMHIKNAEQCLEKSKSMIEEKIKYLEQHIDNEEKGNASDKSKEIERYKTRQSTGTGVTIGGAVLTAIPIIGWIPGIIMLAVGTSEIVKASNAISNAESERKKEIEELQQNLQFTTEIQEMVRKAEYLLAVLRGKVYEMERQAQNFINWVPVKEAMKDVMKAAEKVAENRLVYSENVSGLIETSRKNVAEIMALLS